MTDALEALGVAMIAAGIYLVAGPGWALVVAGGLILAIAELRGWAVGQSPELESESDESE